MKPSKALDRAIEVMGSQSALARACGVRPQAVQQWVLAGQCPAMRAAEIEQVTWGKVRREQLRPDIYVTRPLQATA